MVRWSTGSEFGGWSTPADLTRRWLLAGVIALLAAPAAGAPAGARIHGRIVAIDLQRGTFEIHHDPFAAMPMAMTMEVKPRQHGDLRKLHVGETIDATVDTTVQPWPATNIRPAPPEHRH